MTLVCSHSNALISTIIKDVHTYNIFNLQSFEVVFKSLYNKFQLKVYPIEGE